MDLERVLYKKMTKDELIDKLIAYKNIECHDRAIAHEFLCMQKEDPSRMNFVTHRLTDIADPKRVAAYKGRAYRHDPCLCYSL